MVLDTVLAAVGVLGAIVAALSLRLRRLPMSEPLMGLVAGVILGPQVANLLPLPTALDDHGLLHEATRLLLAVSVMAVALRYPMAEARRQLGPVLVLVVVVMPVMALVTAGLSWLFLGVTVAAAALLGTAVCPTDPVLASSAVTGEPAERDLPARDRQMLSLESGANDGLALPLVLAAVAMAGPLSGRDALVEALWQVAAALALGVLAGWAAARAMRLGEEHGATETSPALLFTLVLALGVVGAARLLQTDSILAVFAAGLAYNYSSTGRDRSGAVPIDEAVNRFAVLPLFLLLGAMLPWEHWGELGWQGPALAVAVLMLRRMPVLLLLRRTLRLGRPDALYLGWFGPVGVSGVFYLTLEAGRLGVEETVLAAGTLVVAASTVAHGLTSALGRRLYNRSTGGTQVSGDQQDADSAPS